MKKTITMESGRNNFHSAGPITIKVDVSTFFEYEGSMVCPLSESQTKRISKHFCGISDCLCGSGPAFEYRQGEWCVPVAYFD